MGREMLGGPFLPEQVRIQLKLCLARAHRAPDQRSDPFQLKAALNTYSDNPLFSRRWPIFLQTPHVSKRDCLDEQCNKIQSGEAIGYLGVLGGCRSVENG